MHTVLNFVKYCPQKKLAKSVHALNFVKYCPQKKLAKSVHKRWVGG